jgi:hypothetical protein
VKQSGPAIEELTADGRLRPQRPDRHTLEKTLESAQQDVNAAAAMEGTSLAWAESILYEAGLRCARVTVQAAGWRITADRGHQTAIDAADALTGGRLHRQFLRLHRMRRVRHEFMYEVGREPTQADIEQARRDVAVLLAEAHAIARQLI